MTSTRFSCSCGAALAAAPEHAETGAVHEHVAIKPAVGQRALDAVWGVRIEQIDGKGGGLRAGGGEFRREFIERLRRSAQEQKEAAIGGGKACDVAPDSGGGARHDDRRLQRRAVLVGGVHLSGRRH